MLACGTLKTNQGARVGKRVAFQGIHGAYSEQAIRQHFGTEVTVIPCHSFGDLFQAVTTQTADAALLPVGTVAGTVAQSYGFMRTTCAFRARSPCTSGTRCWPPRH
jgi:prephenate dehydratase